jgi:hypothetical protein
MESPQKRRLLKASLIIAAALVLLPFWLVFAAVVRRIPTRFMRHKNGVLQTPVVFYKHPMTGRQIVFVAVIHIGEADYYVNLQELIDGLTNHAVLYEAVKKLTPVQRKSLTPEERRVLSEFDAARKFIETVKTLLGVTHQKEGLTYHYHWTNTDIAMLDLLRLFVDRKLHIVADSKSLRLPQKNSAFYRWAIDMLFRNLLAVVIVTRIRSHFSSIRRELRRVILDLRNEIAFDAIREHLKEENVVTIWGAEHHAGMEKAIHADGFLEVHRTWFDAYRPRRHSFLKAVAAYGSDS